MVSVCMATRDGVRYLREQIDSILPQLSPTDELVISDDASDDGTVNLISSYSDSRVKLIRHATAIGITKNFEQALSKSTGELVFLSDQDDIWKLDKIEKMTAALTSYDLAICDCAVASESGIKSNSFFANNGSRKGLLKNLFRNSYMGCCMGFRRRVLERALPFPHDIPIHDFWIGLIAELHFRVKFIDDQLVHHRRHTNNASTTGEQSAAPWLKRLDYRYRIVKGLILQR